MRPPHSRQRDGLDRAVFEAETLAGVQSDLLGELQLLEDAVFTSVALIDASP